MKKYLLFTIATLILQSCRVSSDVSEWFIKTQIQEHITSEFSMMNLSSFYSDNFLELVGYNTESESGLLIKATSISGVKTIVNNKPVLHQEHYFKTLSINQIEEILDILPELLSEIDSVNLESKGVLEYVDYTVDEEFFISYCKDYYSYEMDLYLWLAGEKYRISTDKFKESLQWAQTFIE